jgi:hypothetical protein
MLPEYKSPREGFGYTKEAETLRAACVQVDLNDEPETAFSVTVQTAFTSTCLTCRRCARA